MNMNYWYKYGSELLDEIGNTKVPENAIAIWFLGQESLVIKGMKTVVYIDPFFSQYLDEDGVSKRKFPPPFNPEDIKYGDVIFCTHNHIDHLDPDTIVPMFKALPASRFVVPAPHARLLEKMGIASHAIIGAKDGEAFKIGELNIVPVRAAHDTYEKDDEGNYISLGYAITLNGVTIFHAGDAVEMEDTVDILKLLKIDVACFPINGRDWKRTKRNIIGNMNAREAADIGEECGADIVIPMHFDMFEKNGENPAHFVDYMYNYHPGRKYHVMVPGERFIYMK